MSFDLAVVIAHWRVFAHGLGITVLCCALAIVAGLALGAVVALARFSRRRWLRAPAGVYIEVVRDTPFLVQAFLVYFLLPRFGLRLGALTAGVLALAFYAGAGFAEAIRGAILSVPKGQMQAARATGMSYLLAMRRIVAPQMMGYLIPALTNQLIGLIKESSVLSIITVPELTMASSVVLGQTFAAVEAYGVVALLYWLLTAAVAAAMAALERRSTAHRLRAPRAVPVGAGGREGAL
jgi:His/Glu/Gln/Arg/opine family amino acid ABC transporter permease subunit